MPLNHAGMVSRNPNPIEQAFPKLKTLLRKQNARTIAQVEQCIARLLREIEPAECLNYFQEGRLCVNLKRSCFKNSARSTGSASTRKVHVIWHHLHRVDRCRMLVRHFGRQLFQPRLDRTSQHRTPIFRAPDDIKLQRDHCSGVLGVSVLSRSKLFLRFNLSGNTLVSGSALPGQDHRFLCPSRIFCRNGTGSVSCRVACRPAYPPPIAPIVRQAPREAMRAAW
jgi:hypothetical protein